jgi:dinuclear metal center YbgI/SA1388 family protein
LDVIVIVIEKTDYDYDNDYDYDKRERKMKRDVLVNYLDEYLQVGLIKDYGPQGLQVETGNEEIKRVALAVDVSPEILHTAVSWQADLLLVHHGILWRNVERIAGPLGARVRLMMQHGINLYAAHLPLDAHPEVGNNAVLAQMLGLQELSWWFAPMGTNLGVHGRVSPLPLSDLHQQINQQLNSNARLLAHGPSTVQHIAILSGAGASEVGLAQQLGADTFITGETSHAHFYAASDYGVNVIFAGHYATETVGVKALGAHLHQKFGLEVQFFDFPTGM